MQSARLTIAALIVMLASTSVDASDPKKTALQEHYVLDRFRVFYTNDGNGAVTQDDVDKSGVPDQVENVARQIWAAHHLYCNVLNFPDPFESERYKGVTCIQVSLRDRNEMGGGNGIAFSSSQRARLIPEGKKEDRALVIAIASQVDPLNNVTPAHELFHLIQYGATYFKNPWYLEGLARWSEHGLGRDGIGDIKYSQQGPWPQNNQQFQQMVKMKYDAEYILWNPIAASTDRDGLLTDQMLGEELLSLQYCDGTPVLRDRLLQGSEVMREILIELGKQDDIAFEELKYEKWTAENQRAPGNAPYLYKGIMDALRRHVSDVGPYEIPNPDRSTTGEATTKEK
ncbi:hypothetical protein [Thalassoglobus polymorphus]|uniref:Plant Basic Secretory Protein n=1 Tax=Thalassoglobus polymorphus TaxID=2527994 RepID=A0A517QIA4_9PLAN|nr:hypothetical protein [Thalassoglobus polymorphus]QDT31369.1 hypothetical protein Mal48_06020 [Thalassoglobus polymorphus]